MREEGSVLDAKDNHKGHKGIHEGPEEDICLASWLIPYKIFAWWGPKFMPFNFELSHIAGIICNKYETFGTTSWAAAEALTID